MTPEAIPEAICNSNLLHFVITLLCRICNVKYLLKIQQNWLVTLCNKIITPIFLAPYLPRLYLYFYKFYGHHTWQADELRCEHVTNKNGIFPFSWGLWLLNLARSYPLIKGCHSQIHITYWSPGHMTKKVLSPFPRVLWSPNLTGWWHTIIHKLQGHESFRSRGHVIFPLMRCITWQGDGFWYWTTTHKVTWFFDHVIICVVSWQKMLYLQFHQSYGHQTWQSGGLWHGATLIKSHYLY